MAEGYSPPFVSDDIVPPSWKDELDKPVVEGPPSHIHPSNTVRYERHEDFEFVSETEDVNQPALPSYEEAVREEVVSFASFTSQRSTFEHYHPSNIETESEQILMNLPPNASVVFCISGGVQLYNIAADNEVSVPSYPSWLAVVQIPAFEFEKQKMFLQVGSWRYPLDVDSSLLFHSSNDAYLVPDLSDTNGESHIGIMLPQGISPSLVNHLDSILRSSSLYFDQVDSSVVPEQLAGDDWVEATEGTEERFQSSENTTEFYSRRRSKERLREERQRIREEKMKLREAKLKLKQKVREEKLRIKQENLRTKQERFRMKARKKSWKKDKDENNSSASDSGDDENKSIDEAAKEFSSNFLAASRMEKAGCALAKAAAPRIKKSLSKTFSGSSEGDRSARSKAFATIAQSGYKGLSQVKNSLEEASSTIGQEVKLKTVRSIEAKYGEDAGEIASSVIQTAQNIAKVNLHAADIGLDSLVDGTVENTVTSLLEESDSESTVNHDMFDKSNKRNYSVENDEKSDSKAEQKDLKNNECHDFEFVAKSVDLQEEALSFYSRPIKSNSQLNLDSVTSLRGSTLHRQEEVTSPNDPYISLVNPSCNKQSCEETSGKQKNSCDFVKTDSILHNSIESYHSSVLPNSASPNNTNDRPSQESNEFVERRDRNESKESCGSELIRNFDELVSSAEDAQDVDSPRNESEDRTTNQEEVSLGKALSRLFKSIGLIGVVLKKDFEKNMKSRRQKYNKRSQ